MKFTKHTLCAALLSALVGCGGSSDSEPTPTTPTTPPAATGFDYNAANLIANVTNQVIVSGYQSLNDKAVALHNATQALLTNRDAASLLAAQTAWKEARVFWEQGESHIFGPVDALSIDPHLDTWPLNTSDLKAILAEKSSFTAEEILTWNDDVQGFHTMEFLLFGDGVADNEKAISEMTETEMEYLVACAEVFTIHTQSLFNAWSVSADGSSAIAYKDALTSPGNTYYASSLAVVEELVQGLIGIVDEVGNGKIAEPFGTSVETADTSLVESQYSWNSLTDFTNNIIGVKNVYLGTLQSNNDSPGLKALIEVGNSELAARVESEINTAITAIESIAGENNLPFRQAIKDEAARARIQAAIDALSTLQTSLESEVVPLLSKWNN
ncbi:Iron-regulated protein A precursor [Pseudoalteromonas luteoviolacea B = ATCC 29581]|nr:Iron-regulated protein A precursor [Pseudoalteromonas luteoviolacea B = ATCC 29581]